MKSNELLGVLDMIAKEYHLNDNIRDKFIENICQEYCCDWLETLVDKENMAVLELGYGDGITLERLSKKTRNYSIVEGSSFLVDVVKEKYPEVEVIHSLFEDYSPAKQYELIFALHVFEHVEDSVFLAKYIKSWLQDNGIMVVIVPNKESMHRRLALQMGLITKLDELSERDYMVGHKKVYSLKSLKEDFLSAGYEIIGEKGFFLKTVANSMMLDYSKDLIYALNVCADELPIECCANIAIMVRAKQ